LLAKVIHLVRCRRSFFAIRESRLENARLLVDYGANLDFQNEVGNYPLYLAARKQDFDIALLLLKAGADVRLKNSFGHGIFELTLFRMDETVNMPQRVYLREVQQYMVDNGLEP